MGRITAGLNMTSFAYESGTYGNVSGTAQWIGLVQSFEPNDTMNVQRLRYHGTNTRNVDKSVPGVEDYGGTLNFYPQDFRMLMFALGSIGDTSAGSPTYYDHKIDELESNEPNSMTSGVNNPFISFGVESTQWYSSGASLIRTYKGCMVDSYELSKDDNSSPLMCNVDIVAKEMSFGSIAPTFGTPTENKRRPYAPFDVRLHFPSGTIMDAKSWSFSINNNIDRDSGHVTNGSRTIKQPTPTEREYSINFSMDAESSEVARLYGLYLSGGLTTENCAFEILNFGGTSGTNWICFSGCDVEMQSPNPIEGINEWNIDLIPKSCDAKIQDQIELYNAW